MLFSCKCCAEKDKQVATLKEEVAFLRSLVQPKERSSVNRNVHIEANGILSGHQEMIPDYIKEQELSAEILSERDKILSGTY